MPGLGTLLNVATVLAGSAIGVFVGERLPQRVRDLVTDGIGLVTLMVAVLDGASVLDPSLRRAVGQAAPVLIVLGSILLGGISGSLLRIEGRLDALGAVLQRKLSRTRAPGPAAGAAPVPAPGPPPAASLGWGVAAAALSVLVIQGGLTAAAAALGGLLSDAQIAAMTATGGLLLAGIAFRLLRLRPVAVADLLPALVAAPVITEIVSLIR